MADSSYSAASLFGVKDLVAVITGGGSGLGAIAAHALVANGAKAVYILGRRKEALVQTQETSTNPHVVHPFICDVTSKDSLTAAVERIRSETGYIDVLFANSGICRAGTLPLDSNDDIGTIQSKLWGLEMGAFTGDFHVNVSGAYFTAIAFLDLLDQGNKRAVVAPKSQIVITSSAGAYSRQPFSGLAYGASKAAVGHVTKQLSTTLAPYKIRVNAIAPGFFMSEMSQNLPFMKTGRDPREEGTLDRKLVPLERIGTEQEYAGIVLFLTSKAGGYLDGNIILADGGAVALIPGSY
ncbi:hypothetical protein E4U42_003050 [Claviceps africana]|uniref:Short chain dehydrogenase/reductase n=1 Tax=Claviceps africana TaxID=83212 RepID=A0A8K0NLV7_9HYPO|nr:hypothetical protein E4U42_003050 [Claviceps africana]